VTIRNAVFWDVTPVALVITDVSEKRFTSIIRVKRIDVVRKTLATCSSATLVLTRATRHHIPEDGILHQTHYFEVNFSEFMCLAEFIIYCSCF
jgi:hypothetical protein